jgi:hypothetical protein
MTGAGHHQPLLLAVARLQQLVAVIAEHRGQDLAVDLAPSHCRKKNTRILRLKYFQATATAARHMFIADARKTRWVLAEMRWGWTLKLL